MFETRTILSKCLAGNSKDSLWRAPVVDNLKSLLSPMHHSITTQLHADVSFVSVRPPGLFRMLSYSDTAHSFCTSTDFPFCRSLQGSSQRIICLHLIASSGSSSLAPNDSVTSFTICVTLLSDLLLGLLAASINFSIDIVTISPLNIVHNISVWSLGLLLPNI